MPTRTRELIRGVVGTARGGFGRRPLRQGAFYGAEEGLSQAPRGENSGRRALPRGFFEALDDVLVHVGVERAGRQADRVRDGVLVGAAVTDDDHSGDSAQERPAV